MSELIKHILSLADKDLMKLSREWAIQVEVPFPFEYSNRLAKFLMCIIDSEMTRRGIVEI